MSPQVFLVELFHVKSIGHDFYRIHIFRAILCNIKDNYSVEYVSFIHITHRLSPKRTQFHVK